MVCMSGCRFVNCFQVRQRKFIYMTPLIRRQFKVLCVNICKKENTKQDITKKTFKKMEVKEKHTNNGVRILKLSKEQCFKSCSEDTDHRHDSSIHDHQPTQQRPQKRDIHKRKTRSSCTWTQSLSFTGGTQCFWFGTNANLLFAFLSAQKHRADNNRQIVHKQQTNDR